MKIEEIEEKLLEICEGLKKGAKNKDDVDYLLRLNRYRAELLQPSRLVDSLYRRVYALATANAQGKDTEARKADAENAADYEKGLKDFIKDIKQTISQDMDDMRTAISYAKEEAKVHKVEGEGL